MENPVNPFDHVICVLFRLRVMRYVLCVHNVRRFQPARLCKNTFLVTISDLKTDRNHQEHEIWLGIFLILAIPGKSKAKIEAREAKKTKLSSHFAIIMLVTPSKPNSLISLLRL